MSEEDEGKWQVETEWDDGTVRIRVLSPDGDGTEAVLSPAIAKNVGIDLIQAAVLCKV